MNKEKQLKIINQIINQSLGEVTFLFMSQDILGTNIEMPEEELNEIAEKTIKKLNKLL